MSVSSSAVGDFLPGSFPATGMPAVPTPRTLRSLWLTLINAHLSAGSAGTSDGRDSSGPRAVRVAVGQPAAVPASEASAAPLPRTAVALVLSSLSTVELSSWAGI